MAGDPRLYTPRGPLFTPGYTPLPLLRRVTEEVNVRVTEEGDSRVTERNTAPAA